MKSKLFDCVTFFQENLQMELRFNILKEVVDKFVVCESIYDHRGKEKKINFSKSNFPEVSSKIEHVVIKKKFPEKNTPWQNQSWQREFIFDGIKDAHSDDLVMFSDPDEIPNPEKIKNFDLVNKYGIFLQNMYTYKLNLFNKYESPWEGTRICKKKDLKSIDWLRNSILMKNLKYSFWRIDKEKNIQIINNGGWHFNYLLNPSKISKKFKSLAETSWDKEEFYNERNIKKKIDQKKDLFNRGHKFDVVKVDESYPDYLKKNIDKYQEWIIE